MDYGGEIGYAEALEETYALKKELGAEVFLIGRSLRSREIPCIAIGRGDKSVLFVGVHHGMERITAALALKFARDVAEGTRWGRKEPERILSRRRLCILAGKCPRS